MFDLVVLDLVLICNGFVCIFLCFVLAFFVFFVSLDRFGFVLSDFVLLGLVFFQYWTKRITSLK